MSADMDNVKARDLALTAELAPVMEPHMNALIDGHMARLEREPDDIMGRLIAAHLAHLAAAFAMRSTAILLAYGVTSETAVNFVCDVVAGGVTDAVQGQTEPLQ
ncbi:hypothetical protein V5F79_01220 [Xanthobacter flavus]|uniref:hypothetical protein n=1 Tax=Xanthobacter flavus TaxID=281 RepID=UPI0037276842